MSNFMDILDNDSSILSSLSKNTSFLLDNKTLNLCWHSFFAIVAIFYIMKGTINIFVIFN